MTGPATRPATRLTVQDWTRAALELMAEEGIAAVKVNRLCERLGSTKGSFYWHFTDLGELHTAMAAHWGEWSDRFTHDLAALAALPPAERLQQMALLMMDTRTMALERAMREWAGTQPAVADAVGRADRQALGAIQQALIETGLSRKESRLRAGILLHVGIGFLHSRAGLPAPTRAELAALITMLSAPVPGGAR